MGGAPISAASAARLIAPKCSSSSASEGIIEVDIKASRAFGRRARDCRLSGYAAKLLFPFRHVLAKQILYEMIVDLMNLESAAQSVGLAGQIELLEILVGFHQCVDNLER